MTAHVLVDAFGARFVADDSVPIMRAGGCHVVDDDRPLTLRNVSRANFRSHRRVLVIDSRIGFTSRS